VSQWDREHPEESLEISQLPPSQQNAAYRDTIGYDPDRRRDECRDEGHPLMDGLPKCRCGRRNES